MAFWVFALLLGSMMGSFRLIGQSANCRSNLMRVTRAFQMYSDDNEDSYPTVAKWNSAISPYLDRPDRLACPSAAQLGRSGGYAMNSSIAGKARPKIDDPARTPLVFDSSNLTANAADLLTSLPKPGRHRGKPVKGQPILPGNNVGYGDGSVRMRFDSKETTGHKP